MPGKFPAHLRGPPFILVLKRTSYPAVLRHSGRFLPGNTGSRHIAGQESEAVGPAPAPVPCEPLPLRTLTPRVSRVVWSCYQQD